MLYFISPMAKTLSTNIQNFCHWPTNKLHSGIVEKKYEPYILLLAKKGGFCTNIILKFQTNDQMWDDPVVLSCQCTKPAVTIQRSLAVTCREGLCLSESRWSSMKAGRLPCHIPWCESVCTISGSAAVFGRKECVVDSHWWSDFKSVWGCKSIHSSKVTKVKSLQKLLICNLYYSNWLLWYVTIICPGTVKTDAS